MRNKVELWKFFFQPINLHNLWKYFKISTYDSGLCWRGFFTIQENIQLFYSHNFIKTIFEKFSYLPLFVVYLNYHTLVTDDIRVKTGHMIEKISNKWLYLVSWVWKLSYRLPLAYFLSQSHNHQSVLCAWWYMS